MSYLALSTIERYLRNVRGKVTNHLGSKVSLRLFLIRKNRRGKASMTQLNGVGDDHGCGEGICVDNC